MLIEREQATGKVQEVYDDIENHFGMVPYFFKARAAVAEEKNDVRPEQVKQ